MHYPIPILSSVASKTQAIIGVSQSRTITPATIISDLASIVEGQRAYESSSISPAETISLNWQTLFGIVSCYMYVLLPKHFPPFPQYYYWQQQVGIDYITIPLDGSGYETVTTFTKTDDFEYPVGGKSHILYISNGTDNYGNKTWPLNLKFKVNNT